MSHAVTLDEALCHPSSSGAVVSQENGKRDQQGAASAAATEAAATEASAHAITAEQAQKMFSNGGENKAPVVVNTGTKPEVPGFKSMPVAPPGLPDQAVAKHVANTRAALLGTEDDSLHESAFFEGYDQDAGVGSASEDEDGDVFGEENRDDSQAARALPSGSTDSKSSCSTFSSQSSESLAFHDAAAKLEKPKHSVTRKVNIGWVAAQDDSLKISLAGLMAAVALNREKNLGTSMEDKVWFDTLIGKVVVDYLGLPAEVVQGIKPLGLIDSPSEPLALAWTSSMSHENCERVVGEVLAQSILNIGSSSSGSSGSYDARTHRCITIMASCLDVSPDCVQEYEQVVAELVSDGALQPNRPTELNEEEKKEKTKQSRIRNLKVGAAALGGAVLVGVTGGLALPALGASLATFGGVAATTGAFMASAGGTALFTTLFTAGGLGLTGYKVNRRIRGLSEFEFRQVIERSDEGHLIGPFATGLHVCIYVSGWHISKKGSKDTLVACQEERDEQEKALDGKPTSKTAQQQESTSDVQSTAGVGSQQDTSSLERQASSASERQDGRCDAEQLEDCTHVGWSNPTNEKLPNNREWSFCATHHRAALGDPFQLVWENAALRDVSSAAQKIAINKVVSTAVTETLKTTALAAIMAAVAWPMLAINSFDYIDNAWAVAVNRAKFAGEELGRAIISGAHGKRPVTLVGHSVGALVIFHCLQYLANKKASRLNSVPVDGLVLDVFLFGAPVTADKKQWATARSIVAGRFVNGYVPNDWILAVLYRASVVSVAKIAGLYRVDVPGVYDIDLSETGLIDSQVDYHRKMDEVMAHVLKHCK